MTLTTGYWSPRRWGCSTGPAAIWRPRSWRWRRSRRWLAYTLAYPHQGEPERAAANEAAAAAASTGDLESKIMANLTLALLDCGDGYAGRALRRLEELRALARTSDAAAAH